MWILMVITSIWVHGDGGRDANIYAFSPQLPQVVCQNLKKIVDDNENQDQDNAKHVVAVCVKVQ
jgi:hypothetical protein